ncbi:MAG: hypothetical protein F2812_06700 [Actinobacteria bacterium]|nr:hypothetical protein [Actinomycetota bacterium]MSW91273.1 hypothetical protein [Actinomycetota bacterium]MSY73292.1 hypothetical protein [Actinomycetota bacterium]
MSDLERVMVVLQGGLGNQLFQYAAGRVVAMEHGASLFFHELIGGVGLESVLGTPIPHTPLVDLRRLVLYDPVTRSAKSLIGHRVRSARLHRSTRDATIRQVGAHATSDKALPTPTPCRLGLFGYFQHPTWFDPALPEVTAMLAATIARVAPAGLLLGGTVVSFRRGDYLRNGWGLDLTYYERALAELDCSTGPVWVISDDPLFSTLAGAWLRHRGFEVEQPPDLGISSRVRDLALLIGADQVVMSNSTFCWWGVVTGDLQRSRLGTRTVVAPREWIPQVPDSSVLLRDGWILT